MSAMPYAKSQAGARELAAILRALTGCDVRREARQNEWECGLEGVPGWSLEVKRQAVAERADIARWWTQASAQARKVVRLPVLFYRADRDQWRAVWPLAAHLRTQSVERWNAYAWTVEGSPEAWAAAAREFALPPDTKTEPNKRGG